jgi:aerobic-type carbon monoxide dehydrogenase small subunit (CoxS/CutS family)
VISLRVNGASHALDAPPDTTLLQALRNLIGLTGTKEACGRGECGACTVLVDGTPILSCIAFATRIRGEVTTIEGLAGELAELRALFADKGAFQCGFCTSGQLVHAAAILRAGLPAQADEAEHALRHLMAGNICRCTGYTGIVDAILAKAGGRGRAVIAEAAQ